MAFDWWERAKIAWETFKASKAYLDRYHEAPRIAELVDLRNDLANMAADKLRLTQELEAARVEISKLKAEGDAFSLAKVHQEHNAYWLRHPAADEVAGPFCTHCDEMRVGRVTLKRHGASGQCPQCKTWHHGVWPENAPRSINRHPGRPGGGWLDPNR